MRSLFYKTILACLICSSVYVYADDNEHSFSGPTDDVNSSRDEMPDSFYKRSAEGWIWKKEPITPKKKKVPEPVVTVAPTPMPVEKKPAAFSVEWLRKNLPILRDKAIDEPTKENVSAYMYAQKVALDKSQIFAETAREVVNSDPNLDTNTVAPNSSFAKGPALTASDGEKNTILHNLSQKGGLWFFFDSTCVKCGYMQVIVDRIVAKYGFPSLNISLDKKPTVYTKKWVNDDGQAKKFGLVMTPTVMYVVPPNNYMIIAQGLTDQSTFEDKILLAAEANNMLTKDELLTLYPTRRGVLDASDVKNGAELPTAEWVKLLKERANKQLMQ